MLLDDEDWMVGNANSLDDYFLDEDEDSEELEITIPHNYKPYPFQAEAWEAKRQGKNRFVFLWHRRAGKDKTMFNMFLSFIMDEWDTAGQYYYCLPTATQAKKVIWNGIDNDGFRFLDHIPSCLVKRRLDNEMFIELVNGSTIQLIGSDNYDRIVGSNPKGLCYSEYSISNPLGWDYMRPVLNRNGGWAMFPYTARGKNHGYKLYMGALAFPDKWYVSKKDITETTDHEGLPLIKESDLDEERALGMSEQMIRQEYYNDFEVATIGAYYSDQLQTAREDKRICRVPIETSSPVFVSFDLGRTDSTAMWFVQFIGKEVRVVGYYENRGQDIDFYGNVLKDWEAKHKARIELCIMPHDARHKTILSNSSAEERIAKFGYKTEIVTSKVDILAGINLVRALFARLIFDEVRCEVGLSMISSYKSKYDEAKGNYTDSPDHDWTSHGADALRYLAVWYSGNLHKTDQTRQTFDKPIKAKNSYGRR